MELLVLWATAIGHSGYVIIFTDSLKQMDPSQDSLALVNKSCDVICSVHNKLLAHTIDKIIRTISQVPVMKIYLSGLDSSSASLRLMRPKPLVPPKELGTGMRDVLWQQV
mmetsp:Transcript_53682/g.114012  ORF Transcript_53682/g.114012 Transcript_53682/m.114012 type:complete len:110 (-) Transcript_53682:543-872(-)